MKGGRRREEYLAVSFGAHKILGEVLRTKWKMERL